MHEFRRRAGRRDLDRQIPLQDRPRATGDRASPRPPRASPGRSPLLKLRGSRQWEERFRDAIADFRFIPAGRVLAGAGTERTVTLFNCFVMGTSPTASTASSSISRRPRSPCSRAAAWAWTSRPSGRAEPGSWRRRRCVGAADLHGLLGFDVPHGPVRGAAARRDDGLPQHRPSRHRGVHRRQARSRASAQLQPVGAGHRRFHDRARQRCRMAPDLRRRDGAARFAPASCGKG